MECDMQEELHTYRERKIETMDASRRDFLTASALGGAALSFFGFDLAPAYAQLRELKIARASEMVESGAILHPERRREPSAHWTL